MYHTINDIFPAMNNYIQQDIVSLIDSFGHLKIGSTTLHL